MSIAPLLPAHSPQVRPEELHPSLWRASQLAHSMGRTVPTGLASLDGNLPGAGWPMGTNIDLLVSQPGIGELRLVAPALSHVAARKIILINPPHQPNILGLASLGIAASELVWLRPSTTGDTLWATEQVLRSGSCGAVLLWANHVRSESMRRLNLAAQTGGETLFFMFRPLSAAQDPSPAQLRLALRPAIAGIEVTFLKRRGPQRDEPLIVLLPSPVPSKVPTVPIRSKPERERIVVAKTEDFSASIF